MTAVTLKMILSLGTLGFVLVFAYVNIRQTERQLRASRERRKVEASVANRIAVAAE